MTLAIQHERALECAHEHLLQLQHDIDTANPDTMLAYATHCDLELDPALPVALLEALAGLKASQWWEAYMLLSSAAPALAVELRRWRQHVDAQYTPFFDDELRNRRKGARAL
ncbi:hypothetical protein [Pseudomonas oryzihabitans]|uniref:hypothetical protein n=1 Tax=Pseudomonas oryzihabitans TaxID=47885 RepID=UPI0028944A28|nr:hypothetical protein [Pseudomonas oryzihabitans]MDT3718470.1 hypothetical protein [Pseudomonas oryzihabitans]